MPRLLSLLLLAALTYTSAAQDQKVLENSLKQELQGKALMIRNFYTDSKLFYDSDGNIESVAQSDCWSRARMRVDKIKLKKDKLELEGKRVTGVYDPATHDVKNFAEADEIRVTVALSDPIEPRLEDALHRIFLTNADDLRKLIPGAFEEFKTPALPYTPGKTINGATPPRPLYTPDPEYSQAARDSKRQGNLVASIIVDKDGKVRDVRLLSCLGLGLDDNTIRTLSSWRFAPALKNGEPAAAQLHVEVHFRLY